MTDSLEVVLSFADSFGRRAFLSLKTNSLSFSLFINPFFFFLHWIFSNYICPKLTYLFWVHLYLSLSLICQLLHREEEKTNTQLWGFSSFKFISGIYHQNMWRLNWRDWNQILVKILHFFQFPKSQSHVVVVVFFYWGGRCIT